MSRLATASAVRHNSSKIEQLRLLRRCTRSLPNHHTHWIGRASAACRTRTLMRNAGRRPFTVEVKNAGRGNATFIPTRVATPPKPSPRLALLTSPAPSAPIVEKRRVLPSLIVPEVLPIEPETAPILEEQRARRPRGRPRKPQTILTAPADASEANTLLVPPATPVEPMQTSLRPPRRLKAAPVAELPRGERWKARRLSRWCR